MKRFSSELRHCRLAAVRNRHTADLARAVGVSRRAIEMAEHGDTVPKPETLEKLIHALGLTVSEARLLRELRDREQAARQGLSAGGHPERDKPRIVQSLVSEAVAAITGEGIAVSDSLRRSLRRRFDQVLTHELGPLPGNENHDQQ